MSKQDHTLSRRLCLALRGLAAATPIALTASRARAATKAAKRDVGYQFTPHGAEHCGGCVSFNAGDTPVGAGTCKIVDGVIPQTGWCPLYSKRP